MTYQEIKERLSKCELTLEKLKNSSYNSTDVKQKTEKLKILRESYMKLLKEAEKTAFINGKPAEYKDEKELIKFKDNQDVKSIETASGKKLKEQEGVKFTVEETKSIAKRVGKAVAQSLKTLGDEVAHMKAKNIEENSFEIYVQYKNDADDQFSFYIVDDTLHLVDFSFDKELTDVGVKPSGEAVVNVDVLTNELVKHFRSLGEMKHPSHKSAKNQYSQRGGVKLSQAQKDAHKKEMSSFVQRLKDLEAKKQKEKGLAEAPEGMYYIKIPKDAASQNKAQVIFNDLYGIKYEINDAPDGIYMYFKKEDFDEGLEDDLMGDQVDILDTNMPLSEASDYAKRRAAERDYQPSKKDKPAKAYKEPKNDYFARRKKESDYNEDVDAQQDGGDLDVGHQDDEPNMLKKDLYDVITYAAKLYKQLDKYDQHDGEVDFPHWWQKKVTLAREYMSAAQHYLEGEEKQPAIDQLALENASAGKEEKFHKSLDKLVHKTFGKGEHEKVMKEDWGTSDQAHMMKQIHKAIGEPDKMPSPFDSSLESAVQDNVDFYWDDWAEYQEDPEQLYDKAKRDYLRFFFKDTFNKMVRMFEPIEEVNEDRFLAASMDDLEQVVRNIAHTGGMSEEDAIELAIRKLEAMLDGRDDIDEGFGKTKKAHDLVVAKMKELAKVYKSGDTSVIAQLKDLTAKKKQLEKILDKEAGDIGSGQELDPNVSENHDIPDVTDMSVVSGGKRYVDMEDMEGEIEIKPGMLVSVKGKVYKVTDIEKGENYLIVPVEQEQVNEEKATCCGKCGRVHVKGTKCKTPYLKGKDHCRTK